MYSQGDATCVAGCTQGDATCVAGCTQGDASCVAGCTQGDASCVAGCTQGDATCVAGCTHKVMLLVWQVVLAVQVRLLQTEAQTSHTDSRDVPHLGE